MKKSTHTAPAFFRGNPILLKSIAVLFVLLFSLPCRSQFYNLPSDYSFSLLTERGLSKKDSTIHSGIKPYIHFFSPKYAHVADSHLVFKFIHDDPLLDLVFKKHFIRIEPPKENFKLRLDPLLNFEGGRDLSDSVKKNLYTNSRGFIASGYIGKDFYFESIFSENQSVFPDYIAQTAQTTEVVPGQGRWKTFKIKGYDYAFSSGFISLQAGKNLNIQLGHGKHKIGHGYRSLLLSDNAFNYPFARITQQWFKGRVQYTNIYAVLMNLVSASVRVNPNTERLFQKKCASFQYLSLNLNRRINLGFFQGLIWQAGDEKNRQHLDWQFFNPVIYSNLAWYGLNDQNNILVGADLKIKLNDQINFYGQYMLDKIKSTPDKLARYGYQTGFNFFDVFGIRKLFFQMEYNYVKDGSYDNNPSLASYQSYSHYNQNLAYSPNDGKELVLIGDYKIKRFYWNIRYHLQEKEGGISQLIQIVNARVGYVINPAYNLNICLGALYRTQNFYNFKTLNNETNYIYLGFRTSIYNLYYDF